MGIKTKLLPQKIFDNDLLAIHKSKVTLTLNKPTHDGMCILDLNKVLMYKFHHSYIKNKYCNNSWLLFTYTDGLIYDIKTKNFYEDFSKDKELFDFSNYSAKLKFYDDLNK